MKLENKKRSIFIILLAVIMLFGSTISAIAISVTTPLYSQGNNVTVHFYNSYGWEKPCVYYYGDNHYGDNWPGNEMNYDGNNWYSYTIHDFSRVRVLFSDNGNTQCPGQNEEGYLAEGEMWFCNGVWYDSKPQSTIVHFYNSNNWSNVMLYYYQEGISNPEWPGVNMQNEGGGWYRYEMVGFNNPKVIFSDSGNNQVPSQGNEGFSVNGEKWYYNGTWYNENPVSSSSVKVHYYNSENWSNVNIYAYQEGSEIKSWPGERMVSEGNSWYQYEFTGYNELKVIFSNNGSNQIPGQNQDGFSVSGEKWYYNGKWYNENPIINSGIKVHYYNSENWSDVNIYAYQEGNEIKSWPGEKMILEGNGWYQYEFIGYNELKVIFSNNGSNQIPGQNQEGFTVSKELWYKNGVWYESYPSDIVVYFYKPEDWSKANIYYYLNDSDTGEAWPGVPMEDMGDNWYKYTITKYSQAKVLFNDGNNQIPSASEEGFEVSGVMWYKDGKWYNYNPSNVDENTLLGDLNGDNIIDRNDIDLLNKYLSGEIELGDNQFDIADVNGDGIVDENDKGLINDYISGEIEEFPSGIKLTNKNLSYEYDKLGRVVKVIYDDENYIEYSYDANGNILKVNKVGNIN